MNGRRSGTREKSRKQALDSAWSMEMSRMTRDGTAEPVSRDQKFSGANGDKECFIFPVQLADREQDWQPCPVVIVIHINKLYIHTAVDTHVFIYRSEPCTNVYAPPPKKYWYLVYKPIQTAVLYQYMYTSKYVLLQLTTSRFGNLTRLIHITLL